MKIDYDLIRTILLKREESPDPVVMGFSIPDYDLATVAYHCKLLYERGYIDKYMPHYADNEIYVIAVGQLTWHGIDYLDSIRDDNVWAKTKSYFKKKALPFAFDLIKEIAVGILTNKITN